MRRALSLAAVAALVAGGCGGGAGEPQRTAPSRASFVGVVAQDAFAAPTPRGRARILRDVSAAGAGLVRQVFDWSQIERRPGRYDFSTYDAYLKATTTYGLDVLPILFRAPRFRSARAAAGAHVTATTTFPPRAAAEIAPFARAIVRRYGPGGRFWKEHPDLPVRPIRAWQIWNEPNFPAYWGGRTSVGGYAALLHAAHDAIKAVDPRAEVVTAGIAQSRIGTPLVTYVRRLLRAGAARWFDTLAIHPYAVDDSGVLLAVRRARRTLDAAGVHPRIWVTEIGWSSGGPGSAFTVGPGRQALYVKRTIDALGRLRRGLGLRGVVYFGWRDAPPYPGGKDFWGLHTGLTDIDGRAKPALAAFTAAARAADAR